MAKDEKMTPEMEADVARYMKAAHAMQSGVAMEMHTMGRASATEPKHLRVGINTTKADHASLVTLLIDKGLFTMAEYYKAMADGMEREQKEYEDRLTEATGTKITLG